MLNETPKPDPKKTKSARKYPVWVRVVFIGLAVVSIAVALAIYEQGNVDTLRLSKGTYHLEVATTDAAQQRGLGGRRKLAQNGGMLFVFSAQSQQCFWMKDMRFPIDIIWADSSKRVTRIEHDLSPATYPHEYCAPAQYVIELNAGTADNNGLKTGQKLDF